MRFPPLFIGFATIFWGFCTGWIPFSIVAAIIFEASNIVKTRFDLQKKDFIRISDLSSVLMLILLFYSYMENEPRMIFLGFITTLPIIFMPLLFAQLFSTSDKVVIGTKFGKKVHTHAPVDIRMLYLPAVLFATSAANIKSVWFIIFFLLLLFVSLSGCVKDSKTLKRYILFSSAAVFATVLIGAIVVGAHILISRTMMNWYNDWYSSLSADPFKTSTAMGEIGKLKLSGEIVFRVYPEKSPVIPLYMKQSDYNIIKGRSWYSRPNKTDSVFPDKDMEWQLFGEGEGSESMRLSVWMHSKKGEGVLPLPDGARRAVQLDVAGIEKSFLGAIYIEEGPELLEFTVSYDFDNRFEPFPHRMDFYIPEGEKKVVDDVMRQNELFGKTSAETLENIERFFAGFKYSTNLKGTSNSSVLFDFLNNTKEGHCEYFASATVLMLRNAGIAARYRTGFMLDEYDSFENALIARKRDAHAWVIAYIGDTWVNVDTTPPQWKSDDGEKKSLFEPVSDFFAWLKLRYEQFRRKKDADFNKILIAVATVLTLFMIIRVYLRKRRVKETPSGAEKPLFEAAGLDSPLYDILDFYEKNGLKRDDSETLRRWIEKHSQELGTDFDFSEFAGLHEALRFDTDADRTRLMSELLEKFCEWKKSLEKKG